MNILLYSNLNYKAKQSNSNIRRVLLVNVWISSSRYWGLAFSWYMKTVTRFTLTIHSLQLWVLSTSANQPSGLQIRKTGKLEDAANDPLWKIRLSKMGTIAKEIRARNWTRIEFSRRAHISCSACVRFFLSLFFTLCNFAAPWALQLWRNMMELMPPVLCNLTWPKQHHSVVTEKMPRTKWEKNMQ